MQLNVTFDTVPKDGCRVRFTCISDPSCVAKESKNFDGKIRWKGVTEDIQYELIGGGPFTHRRIVFSSPAPWLCQTFTETRLPCTTESSFARFTGSNIADPNTAAGLHRLFTECTIRGLVFGPTHTNALTILEDKRYQYNAKEEGLRLKKRFWNWYGLGKKGRTLKYKLSPATGKPTSELEDTQDLQHVYICDVFQFGLNGLHERIQTAADLLGRGGESSMKKSKSEPKAERHDSNDSTMTDVSGFSNLSVGSASALGVEAMNAKLSTVEKTDEIVRCFSKLRVYWYSPK